MQTLSRSSGGSASACGSSVRMAMAPRAIASAAKLRPSCLLPGNAANRKPGCTFRESAVRPTISGSFNPVGAGAGAISSVSFKPLALQTVDHQRPLDLGRRFVDRLHTEERRDPLDYPAGCRSDGPAGGSVAVALLVGVRFVDHGQDQVFRIVDRKNPDKARKQLFLSI